MCIYVSLCVAERNRKDFLAFLFPDFEYLPTACPVFSGSSFLWVLPACLALAHSSGLITSCSISDLIVDLIRAIDNLAGWLVPKLVLSQDAHILLLQEASHSVHFCLQRFSAQLYPLSLFEAIPSLWPVEFFGIWLYLPSALLARSFGLDPTSGIHPGCLTFTQHLNSDLRFAIMELPGNVATLPSPNLVHTSSAIFTQSGCNF